MAKCFGWTKDYIFNRVYPEELNLYMKLANMAQLEEYMMQTQIAANPHSDKPSDFFDSLKAERDKLGYELDQELENDQFDRAAFNDLKAKLAGSSNKILIKD